MSISYKIALAMVALIAAFPEDMNQFIILHIGTMQVYAIDIVYLLILGCMVLTFFYGYLKTLPLAGKVFVAFLVWIAIEIIIGYTRFGFRAIGESRYILAFYGFFVPFIIIGKSDRQEETLMRLLRQIILVAGWAGIVMFVVEVLHGGRFFLTALNQETIGGLEDFRGVRYLGSFQAFNIMMLGMLVFLEQAIKRIWNYKKLLFAIVCLAIVLITKNRTALFAPCGALVIALLLRGQFRYILSFIIGIAFAFILMKFFAPNLFSGIIVAVGSGFTPATDETGMWRMYINASALEQSMETPWLGHAYGGYFSFSGPGGTVVEYPPHNQYIILFLKTGIIGVGLFVFALISSIVNAFSMSKRATPRSDAEFISMFFLVFLLSQLIYGMAYGFVPTFGLFFGVLVMLFRIVISKEPSFFYKTFKKQDAFIQTPASR